MPTGQGAAADYSITVRDVNGVLVDNSSDATETGGVSYQPLNSDLTTISGQTNAAYGLQLLELANQAALQSTVGVGSAGLLAKALALFLYLAGFVAILSGALDEKLQLDGIEWLMLIGAALAWPVAAIILTAARMWRARG